MMIRRDLFFSFLISERQNVTCECTALTGFSIWFLLFDSWISTSGMTLPCCVCPLMPYWTLTSSWPICLPLTRFCPTTTSATSPDGDAPPVSWLHATLAHFNNVVVEAISIKLNVPFYSILTFSSWRPPVCTAQAGLPSCGRLCNLLQVWLVGQHCENNHGVWWRWCWGRMQCESPM